jgi:hypothetical protein
MKDRIRVKTRVIKKPDEGTRTVFLPSGKVLEGVDPFFKGKGIFDYLCGNCGYILGQGLDINKVKNIIVKCPNCEQYSEFVLNPDHF